MGRVADPLEIRVDLKLAVVALEHDDVPLIDQPTSPLSRRLPSVITSACSV